MLFLFSLSQGKVITNNYKIYIKLSKNDFHNNYFKLIALVNLLCSRSRPLAPDDCVEEELSKKDQE